MNPFNAIWDTTTVKVTTSQLKEMWQKSDGGILASVAIELDIINDEPTTTVREFELTPQQCRTLQSRSVYYAKIFSDSGVDYTENVPVTINTWHLDLDLVQHLILSNTRDVEELPDFRRVNVKNFVSICALYEFDGMLESMINFCVTTGLHYFPKYFEAMVLTFGLSHPKTDLLWRMFIILWNQSQNMLIHDYFLPEYPHFSYHDGAFLGELLFRHRDLLPGMVRSLIQSPSLRAESPFLVCQVCELPINSSEVGSPSVTITTCCKELLHTACRDSYFVSRTLCDICCHANFKLQVPQYMRLLQGTSIRGVDFIPNRRLVHWKECSQHDACCVYERPDWSTVHHCVKSKLDASLSWNMSEFMDFMNLLYSREYHYVTTIQPVIPTPRLPELQKPQLHYLEC